MRVVQSLYLSTILAVGCGAADDLPGSAPDAAMGNEPGLSWRLREPTGDMTVPMSASGLNMGFEQAQAALTNTSGCPGSYSNWGTATMNQDIADATELTSRIRKSFGFDCVNESPSLSIAAWHHAKFTSLAVNNLSCFGATWHDEVAGCPEFTGASFSTRIANSGAAYPTPYAEVLIGGHPGSTYTAQNAIDAWMMTAYHQLPFIECAGDQVGFGPDHHPTGDWRQPTIHSMNMDFARSPSTCTANGVSHWPHSGTWGVNRSWDGNEAPVPPVSYPSGPVFTVRHPGATMVTGVNLLDLSTSPATSVPGNFFTGHSPDPHHDPNNLLLSYEAIFIPTSPLKAQTFYEIHFPTTNGEIWWQIKTGD